MFGPSFSQFNPGRRSGGGMAPQPIILATAGLRIASVVFNHADFLAITEKTIVPAVAGYWINPIWWSSSKKIPVTPYAPTNVTFLIMYDGSTISRLTGLTPVVTSAGTRIDRNGTAAGAALDPASLAVGKALKVRNPTANGGGAAANKIRFTVIYELVPDTF